MDVHVHMCRNYTHTHCVVCELVLEVVEKHRVTMQAVNIVPVGDMVLLVTVHSMEGRQPLSVWQPGWEGKHKRMNYSWIVLYTVLQPPLRLINGSRAAAVIFQ